MGGAISRASNQASVRGLNVIVDWRGGIRTRPGTVMAEPLFEDAANPGIRLSTFSFNTDPEDNYLLVWKHERLFFIQEGRYLYTSQPRVLGNALLTGFFAGDIVLVHEDDSGQVGRYLFTGKVVDGNTVCVPWKTQTVNLTASQRVVRAYSIPTPYDAQDIHDLKLDQFRDDITITHRAYRARILRRTLIGEAASFNFQTISFLEPRGATNKESTERTRANDFADNEGGFQWTVGIVDEEGVEHPLNYSDVQLEEGVDIGTDYLDLTWDEDPQAQAYRIYASAFKPDFSEGGSPVEPDPNSTPALPSYGAQAGTEGESFNIQLPTATGGDGTITYSIQSGSVPGATFNPNNRRLTSSSLTTAGTYTLTYRATDVDGDYDELTFTVTVADPADPTLEIPGVPTNFSIQGQTENSITVEFNPPTSGGAPSTYRVVYSDNSNITGADPTTTGSGSPITVGGLSSSSTYYVAVRAENNAGESPYTTAIQVTTGTGEPVRNSQKDIMLGSGSWTDGMDDDGTIWFLERDGVVAAAYDAVTLTRMNASDLTFESGLLARGIVHTGNRVFVIDNQAVGVLDIARAYSTTGSYISGEDFTLLSSTQALGCASDGTTMWFPDNLQDKAFAYTVATRARDTSKDIALGSGHWQGIIYHDSVLWVVDGGGGSRAVAYDSETLARLSIKDIDLFADLGTSNWNSGVGSNGTIWFVQRNTNAAYAYDV